MVSADPRAVNCLGPGHPTAVPARKVLSRPGRHPVGAPVLMAGAQPTQPMTRYLWIAVAALSVTGCGLVKSDSTTPSTPVSNTYDYTAIGASDAIGYGSSNVCFPFTACPNGTGYVQDLGRQYQTDHPSVTFALLNMGIPGAVLGPS